MGAESKIEWTDATWTPIRARLLADAAKVGWHCEHVSEGCRHCYAEAMNRRLGTGLPFKPGHRCDVDRFLDEKMLTAPLRWRRPRKVFVCSMTDLFADFVPNEWIDRMFAVMALAPQHVFQVLTKRPERMRAYLSDPRLGARLGELLVSVTWPTRATCDHLLDWSSPELPARLRLPLPNVWLGTSVEDQAAADERVPYLLATPAAVRFLSCEPLLGLVRLTNIDCHQRRDLPSFYWINALTGEHDDMCRPCARVPALDWVIVGGESGKDARPIHPDWARSLRDQCADAGASFFFKQWGEFRPYTAETDNFTRNDPTGEYGDCRARHVLNAGEMPGAENIMIPVGKKAAGRLLDGVTHDGMPA